MQRIDLRVPIFLPKKLYCNLRKFKHKLSPPVKINLWGDRDVEWSFCAAHMPTGSGEAIDLGCGGSYMGLLAAQKGFRVTAINLEPVQWAYVHINLHFLKGDLFNLSLPKSHFDLIINCSTVEHIGLVGRYGVTENRPDGDLEAMALLSELLKASGRMMLTIPCGQDTVLLPLHRVYGEQRLPYLLKNYVIDCEEYWIKNNSNQWIPCDRSMALSFKAASFSKDPLQNVYALGCFVLRKH
jgi:hypothetical protein